jgi:hypothetical protein
MTRFNSRKAKQLVALVFILAILGLTLSACIYPRPSRGAPGSDQTPMFIPPELNPSTPTPDAASAPNGNQQATDCTNNLKFVSDITIPDGTPVKIGEAMEKKWEVENAGTCNWVAGYTLRLLAGGSLGANPEQALFPALAGAKATIQMNILAPTAPGDYKSAWQAYSPDGKPFGDVIYIQIVVKE